MPKLHAQLLTALFVSVSGMSWAAPARPAELLNDSLPARWSYNEHLDQSLPTDDAWWHSFHDPMLDSLISAGVDNNYNVAMAARRIEIARQSLNSARAAYLPALDFSGGWSKQRTSGALGPEMGQAVTSDYFALGIDMSWQIDVFGKIRAKSKQQKAAYNATRAEYAATMVTLCSNIAKAYINLRMWQAEWTVATEHIASQERIVKMTEARHEAGLASMLDVTQAQVVYNSTRASLPSLESGIHTTINSLAVLIGVYPEEIYDYLMHTLPMPDYRQIVPVGIPAELLRRRPDIVQAEYELAGYAAALGIAKKEFLPTLSLNGSIGTSAHRGGDLFKNGSLTYAIAPTLSWTIFDGMARRYNAIAAREQMEIGIENYNLTVMTAYQEVDNAIANYEAALKRIEVLNKVIEQSRKSLELSIDQYKSELSAFTNVVDAQLNLLEYQNSLVTAHGSALTSLVNLYQALGGGWDNNIN